VAGHAVALTSIEHRGAKVSVHYRHGDLEVMTVDIAANGKLDAATLRGRASWHLVIEGEAIFEQAEHRWEVLPEQSMTFDGPTAYTIQNPSRARLRLLTVVLTEAEDDAR
jgi:mannose-6-phosphate isomerase-like protein (cupin superfamily)